MTKYEYKIVSAPVTAVKVRRMSGKAKEVAGDVSELMNELGEYGWEYVRSETLKTRRRRWLIVKEWRTCEVMVFRRVFAKIEAPEDMAGAVITEPVVIEPRRVRNVEAVRRAKAGERRIHLKTPESNIPANKDHAIAVTAAE